MADIVTALRQRGGAVDTDAADEIERLRAEVSRLREWDPYVYAMQADRDKLAETNRRLVAELGDARQSVIDLKGANAAYERARQDDYARRVRLWSALSVAYKHLDLDALRVSHAKDAWHIESTLWNVSETFPLPRLADPT